MSWMRRGHPLYHFKGDSTEYVFSDGKSVTDYESTYDDNCSFIELIHNMVKSDTGDEEYADKILLTLAHKLGVEDKLRLTKDGGLEKMIDDEYENFEMEETQKHKLKLKTSCEGCPEYKPHSVSERCATCEQWELRIKKAFSN